jgi:hypothetical protein
VEGSWLQSFMSSANKMMLDDILSGRWFMYRRNSNGPSTDPWGTPLSTCLLEDNEQPIFTWNVLLDKKLSIQFSSLPLMP